ncbi:MAG: glycosyltransferase [Xanthomonadales bacterium]|nr:glycosyltransferase [Xanthomonadales bacterium]
MTANPESVSISAVIPVYSGADFLAELIQRLAAVRAEWLEKKVPFQLCEVVCVTDEPRDDSCRILEELGAQHHWLKVVGLSRNFGQHPATIAGILHTSGDWVVTLDEDLQHPPENIVQMLKAACMNHADVVYASPGKSVHQSFIRDMGSRAFKKLTAVLTREPSVVMFSSFRLVRGPIARAACSVCGHETYLDIALCWFTQRFRQIPMDLKDVRVISGLTSGYSIRPLLSHARRMIMSSQLKILRTGVLLGFFSMSLSVVLGIYVLITEYLDPGRFGVQGWPSLILTILFFGGVSALLLGASLEYLTNLVLKAQGKPTFFVVDRSRDRILAEYFSE